MEPVVGGSPEQLASRRQQLRQQTVEQHRLLRRLADEQSQIEAELEALERDEQALLGEAARVARKRVIVAEDVLDRRASRAVVDSYRAHDPWAIYRSTGEWLELAKQKGLVLLRIVVLDRVPLHVAREARPACELDYPPMQYYVFCVAVCV